MKKCFVLVISILILPNGYSQKSEINSNLNEYKLYDSLTNENCHINYIQIDHYLDEGCICKACSVKRMEVASLIQRGLPVTSRILHNAAKNAFLQKRFRQINKINRVLNNLPPNSKPKGFKSNLNNLVNK